MVYCYIDGSSKIKHEKGYSVFSWKNAGNHNYRLKLGDKPKNKLDGYCKQHDIFYHNNPDTESRNKAYLVLADQAWERVKSWDASIGERAATYAVMNAMKAKAKIGLGRDFSLEKKERYKNNKNGQLRTIKKSEKHTRGLYARRVKKTKSKKGRKRNN